MRSRMILIISILALSLALVYLYCGGDVQPVQPTPPTPPTPTPTPPTPAAATPAPTPTPPTPTPTPTPPTPTPTVVPPWDAMFGGDSSDYAKDIIQTSDKGFIVVGYTFSEDIRPTHGRVHDNADFYIVKLDQQGNKVWDAVYGGNYFDAATSVVQTSDGGYIVAGYAGSTDLEPTSGDHSSYNDFYILRLNSDGSKVWDLLWGGDGFDEANEIIAATDSGYIIAGFCGSENLRPDRGANDSNDDFIVMKISDAGEVLWTGMYGGNSNDRAYSITSSSDGGYLLAGYTQSRMTPTNGAKSGGADFYAVKISSDGNKEWDSIYGGSDAEQARSVTSMSDGGFVVAGFSKSYDQPAIGQNKGRIDMYLIKLNSSGAKEWDAMYGGNKIDFATSVTTSNDNGILVAGYTRSTDISTTHGQYAAGLNYYVLKLNSDGTLVWDAIYGGASNDSAASIIQGADDLYVVAGTSFSYDIQPQIGQNNDYGEMYIIRFNN